MKVVKCLYNGQASSFMYTKRLKIGKEYEIDESNVYLNKIKIFIDGAPYFFFKGRFSEPYEPTSIDLVAENSISKQFEEKVKLMLNVHNKGNSTESGECQ